MEAESFKKVSPTIFYKTYASSKSSVMFWSIDSWMSLFVPMAAQPTMSETLP